MPKGRLSPLANTSFETTLASSPSRSTRMRPGPVSATKISPFGATRSTRGSGQAVGQQLDLESLRHERRGAAARCDARGIGDRRRGARFGQILRADQPDGAGPVGLPAAIGILALQHRFGLHAGAGDHQPRWHHHQRNMDLHVAFLPDFTCRIPRQLMPARCAFDLTHRTGKWRGSVQQIMRARPQVAVIKAAASAARLMG